MSRSTDPGHFFQTDAATATLARRDAKSKNKNGNPILTQSKILDIIVDPFSNSCVYIAEGTGCVRRVNIETRDTNTVYRGPAAPVTSVAIGGARGNIVFAGCWDKDIWSWERDSRAICRRYKGHSDFVKAIICVKLSGKDCLISGGADAKIMVWDTTTGQRLHMLQDRKDTMMAVQYLAVDLIDTTEDEVVLVSSSSDPGIRWWRVSLTSAAEITNKDSGIKSSSNNPGEVIREHETSVYKLLFDFDDGDLWTASADGTTKCLSRARNWSSEETIEHGDYVRAVALTSEWIITAGRDENVKVWDRSTGKLFFVYEGHFQEVTGLVIINEGKGVLSASIDGTLRTWPLDRGELEKKILEKEEDSKGLVEETRLEVRNVLTEEEEAELAELAELMEDSE